MIEHTFHTPHELALDLSVPAGTIDVQTIDGDETHVELDADNEQDLADARVELRERSGGHELIVEVDRYRGRKLLGGLISLQLGGGRYRLRVRCPHGATLGAKTASADVRARGAYASAQVETASGDVDVETVAEAATVKTASGRVQLGEVGGDASVHTVSGDARLRAVGGGLRAQTISGDLQADEVAGPVKSKTVSGDQRLGVREGEVELTSISGDIRVGIKAGSRLWIDANSVSGELDSELPLADLPAAGEGPLVELRGKTVSGDFRVVRA